MHQRYSPAGRFFDALHSIRRDLAHAVRSLFKERTFTLVCVVSLGIAMGAFVALVTFNRTVAAPARGISTDGLTELLVLPVGPLRAKAGVWALERWSYPDYQALRDADTGMGVTGWTREFSQFGTPAPDQSKAPPRVATLYVSANYFRTFGVSLARGSGFDPAIDDKPSAEPRVVLSHDFWRSRVASDPDIVGKSVTIDGVPHVVVGITPDDFHGHFHRVFRMMLADFVRLVVPGVAGGLLLAAVLIRTMEGVMGTPLTVGPTPLGVMEPVIYLAASTIAVGAALLAGLPAARRATTVQPMVAMRSE